jgi:hypothetical protein
MDAIGILEEAIAKAIAGNDVYDSYQAQWRYLLESYMGGLEYKNARHLVRYQLETDGEYQSRLNTTPLDNHCASVISVYNSFLFRKAPDRDLATLDGMPEVTDFLKDADFAGRSLDAFMKEVSTWSSVFGNCWVMVTKPDIGATNRAQEQAAGVRPYVSLLTPLAVLDWSWVRLPSGRYELDRFRYIEDINNEIQTIKVWTKETIQTLVIDEENSSILEDVTVPNGLGKIPAIAVYNKKSVVRGIGVSDIADIADCQKFIYNATSEIDQSIRLDSHPSLVKTSDTNAGIGAGSLIHMPENLDPGLKPYVLEFTGASIDKILAAIQHQIAAIDKMANIGAVRAIEAKSMSGVAMETEFQLLNAKLSEKGDNLELAEEKIWELVAEYVGMQWDGEVEYPSSFNLRDKTGEISQLKVAAETSESPQVKLAIAEKVLEWLKGEDDEYVFGEATLESVVAEEYVSHDMVDADGNTRTANSQADHDELTAQGYTRA